MYKYCSPRLILKILDMLDRITRCIQLWVWKFRAIWISSAETSLESSLVILTVDNDGVPCYPAGLSRDAIGSLSNNSYVQDNHSCWRGKGTGKGNKVKREEEEEKYKKMKVKETDKTKNEKRKRKRKEMEENNA